jgi:hypothetical protein
VLDFSVSRPGAPRGRLLEQGFTAGYGRRAGGQAFEDVMRTLTDDEKQQINTQARGLNGRR